jgi:hypothetical protein
VDDSRSVGRNGRVLVAIVSAIVVGAFFAPGILFDRVPVYRDFINTFLPFRLYAASAIAAGRLPLWVPELSLGAPFLGNWQSAVLYPFSAAIHLMPGPVGVGLFLAFHFWVAAAGIDALLSRRGLPVAARLLGVTVYTLGGFLVSTAAWGHLVVAAWTPVAIVAAERLADGPSARRFGVLVTVLALEILGGAPETLAQSALLTVAAGAVAFGRTESAALVVLAIVLAAGIAAPQLLAAAEYARETTRASGLAVGHVLHESLEPASFATLLVPHRLDGGILAPIAESRVPLVWSIYIGLAPLLFVAVGAFGRRGIRWAAVLAGALVLALGTHTPVAPALLRLLPEMPFRYPQKFLLSAHLAVAVLAALGMVRFGAWVGRTSRVSPRGLALGFAVLTLIDLWDVHFPALLWTDWRELRASAPPPPLRHTGPGARLFTAEPNRAELRPWFPRFRVSRNLLERERDLWREASANVPLAYGIDLFNGSDGFERRDLAAFHDLLARSPPERALRLLRTFGVAFVLSEAPRADADLRLAQRGASGVPWVYRLDGAVSRVYVARRVIRAGDVASALLAVAADDFVPGADAVAEGVGVDGAGGGSARIVVAAPEALTIDTLTENAALLVVNDAFFPGWRAEIDGRPAPILRANGLVRGVVVPAGAHRTTMTYAPAWFRLGLAISTVSMVATVLIAARLTPA